MKALLVTADSEVRSEIEDVFERRKHTVETFDQAAAAGDALGQGVFFFLLLDLAAGSDVIDLCRTVRRRADGYRTYVVVLPRRETTGEVRAAFEAGADDYLPKPIQRSTLQVKLAIGERTLAARQKRVELETELTNARRRHTTLLETLHEGVFETDEQGRIVFANSRLAAMTGWSQDDLVGRPVDELVEKKYRDRLPGQSLLGGGTDEYSITLRRRGGGRRWVELVVTPVPGLRGQNGGTLGVVQDVTEQREAEESLRHREEYYRALLENSSDLISILDLGGRILFQSQTSQRLLGLTPEEMVGDDLPHFLHPDDRDTFEQALETVLAEPGASSSVEVRFRRKNEEYVYLESVLRNQVDNPVLGGLLVTSRDVTERRQVEQALKRERAFFQQLFRNSPAGIVILDNEDRVVDANRSFVELFQFEPENMAGGLLSDFIVPDDLRGEATALSSAVFEKKTVDKETLRLRKDGSLVDVSILGYPIELADRKIGAYGIYSDISERKAAERKLYHHAFHDALTGLPNRTFFTERLQRDLVRAQRRGDHQFAVLFIDLDRFKVINDSLGHAAGDDLLVEMAQRLEACLRPGDTVARLGGDEFTILLEEIEAAKDATRIAERILESLSEPFEIAGQDVVSSGSIGIAFSSTGYSNADELLRDADIAMYRAKGRGKARYEIFDAEMHKSAVERLRLEGQLRQSIERGELELHYQPIVDLRDGHITGFEALVRWRHPTRGLLEPGHWIGLCDEAGLMPALGRWVVGAAARTLHAWRGTYPNNDAARLSINVSTKEITHPEFLDRLAASCREAGADPCCLGLEITESLIVEAQGELADVLGQLRDRGHKLSIDDFGTGLSSLASLHRYPIDTLKIDRSFVRELGPGSGNLQIVGAVAALADNLGLHVVAEGVENETQLVHLREIGVGSAQGYFFSKPLPAEEAEALLSSGPAW